MVSDKKAASLKGSTSVGIRVGATTVFAPICPSTWSCGSVRVRRFFSTDAHIRGPFPCLLVSFSASLLKNSSTWLCILVTLSSLYCIVDSGWTPHRQVLFILFIISLPNFKTDRYPSPKRREPSTYPESSPAICMARMQPCPHYTCSSHRRCVSYVRPYFSYDTDLNDLVESILLGVGTTCVLFEWVLLLSLCKNLWG